MAVHWTREERYRRLDSVDPEEYDELTKAVANAPWRQKYHVQPLAGLLNDPNGFSWYNGQYHLFYQWFPLGPAHGLKYWYHTVSDNLVTFENKGIALSPDTPYDSHGVYSGSALQAGEDLMLFYTGNTRDEKWLRTPYQCMAKLDRQGVFTKWPRPVITGVPDGFTQELRDPKLWKEDGMYYCVIGAQQTDQTGAALLYKSEDLHDWHFIGEVRTELGAFGYMWECPDLFSLQGTDFLVFSPLGLKPEGLSRNNLFHAGYISGEFDLETGIFHHGPFTELDNGFDFYAPQTMEAPDGTRILIAWMAVPQLPYPTDKDGWANCMTLPRVLTVEEGRLKQRLPASWNKPAEQAATMELTAAGQPELLPFGGDCYELQTDVQDVTADEVHIDLRVRGLEYTRITYDRNAQQLIFDRSRSGEPVNASEGHARITVLSRPLQQLRILVDVSSVEIFINDGDAVMTSRIFPGEDSTGIRVQAEGGTAKLSFRHWTLDGIAFKNERIL
ncbi:glycoside hydrolase family 32 protein [Sporosarcina trichiuri]|uniref:glycoside hydrolase family 32 protein n=1 Tax=Sporosarcina trichiuri TaxID=3056445 RepID=UPI0025B4ACC8|nr:sucrose-6-phosphate hydrolase [Sporosarcina sp. 0.2-SM1T-5]WJY27272.1 sucrose-6-phosphate hydrolase [Sporosarcina sp. 0.2-SM1T-5]